MPAHLDEEKILVETTTTNLCGTVCFTFEPRNLVPFDKEMAVRLVPYYSMPRFPTVYGLSGT